MREVSKRPYGARLMAQTSQALVGDIIAVDLPDPIPNSEVKHQQAHGTAGVTLWESRYRRPQSLKPSVESKDSRGLFRCALASKLTGPRESWPVGVAEPPVQAGSRDERLALRSLPASLNDG